MILYPQIPYFPNHTSFIQMMHKSQFQEIDPYDWFCVTCFIQLISDQIIKYLPVERGFLDCIMLVHSLGTEPMALVFLPGMHATQTTLSEKQYLVNSRFSSSWCTKDAALDKTSKDVSILALGQTLSMENQIIKLGHGSDQHMD